MHPNVHVEWANTSRHSYHFTIASPLRATISYSYAFFALIIITSNDDGRFTKSVYDYSGTLEFLAGRCVGQEHSSDDWSFNPGISREVIVS